MKYLKRMILLTVGVFLLLSLSATHGEAVSSPAGAIVVIDHFAFGPATITIPAGTTVTWTNGQAYVMHTVTSTTGFFDSRNLSSGQTFQFTFNTPGPYDYFCRIHPFMTGKVVVSSASAPGSGGSVIDRAIDVDHNDKIDDAEIIAAVSYWTSGQAVPGTNGHTLSDADIVRLVILWTSGASISSETR